MTTPKPLFELRQAVISKIADQATPGVIWGKEYSDGGNPVGNLKSCRRGWYYHLREEGTEREFIVHEANLIRV